MRVFGFVLLLLVLLVVVVSSNPVDRQRLEWFYKSTNGESWLDNTNWMSEKPLYEWQGIECNEDVVISMSLSENNLTGTLPSEIFEEWLTLSIFMVDQNSLSGTIPSEFGTLKNIRQIYLTENSLSGTIPSEIAIPTKIYELYFGNNSLVGTIPTELGVNYDCPETFDFSLNMLTGTIPSEIFQHCMREINFSNNNLTGEIPSEFGKLTSLTVLNLAVNQLTGSIPTEFGLMNQLSTLNLEDNSLSGELYWNSVRSDNGNFVILRLSNNLFSGPIPPNFGGEYGPHEMYLNRNNFSGTIPSELSELVFLTILNLSNNRGLTGTLPRELQTKDFQQFIGNNVTLTGPLYDSICDHDGSFSFNKAKWDCPLPSCCNTRKFFCGDCV